MSEIHRFTGKPSNDVFTWENVETKIFNTEDVKGFFQVPVGESTFNHAHPHEHGIVILHGNARVMIEEETYDLKPFDSVFISGGDHHQVNNTGETSLGFICVIPSGAE